MEIKCGELYKNNQGSEFTVLKYNGWKNILIEFNDAYKFQLIVNSGNLRNGTIKNPYHPSVYGVGFQGIGKYKAYIDSKPTIEYTTWTNILMRCYDSRSLERQPTYIGCSVSESWLNFQNFAEWFVDNHIEGWFIDKDLAVLGNTIYSSKFCSFVPRELNNLLTDSVATRGNLPQGVYLDGNRYSTKLSKSAKNIYLGCYSTSDEAYEVYKTAKEYHVRSVADRYKDIIDNRIYENLINYRLGE